MKIYSLQYLFAFGRPYSTMTADSKMGELIEEEWKKGVGVFDHNNSLAKYPPFIVLFSGESRILRPPRSQFPFLKVDKIVG
jgi:hypothetical protein